MYLMNLFKIHQVYLVNITRIGWPLSQSKEDLKYLSNSLHWSAVLP